MYVSYGHHALQKREPYPGCLVKSHFVDNGSANGEERGLFFFAYRQYSDRVKLESFLFLVFSLSKVDVKEEKDKDGEKMRGIERAREG